MALHTKIELHDIPTSVRFSSFYFSLKKEKKYIYLQIHIYQNNNSGRSQPGHQVPATRSNI